MIMSSDASYHQAAIELDVIERQNIRIAEVYRAAAWFRADRLAAIAKNFGHGLTEWDVVHEAVTSVHGIRAIYRSTGKCGCQFHRTEQLYRGGVEMRC